MAGELKFSVVGDAWLILVLILGWKSRYSKDTYRHPLAGTHSFTNLLYWLYKARAG